MTEYRVEVLDGEWRRIGDMDVDAHNIGNVPVLRLCSDLPPEEYQAALAELSRFISEMGEEAIIVSGAVEFVRLIPMENPAP
jgi:hypothetical protein